MSEKIKIGAVSYLNTKPLTYGLQVAPIRNEISLSFAYPAALAELLIHEKIDVGLVPAAVIPLVPNARIISDFCIGAEGKVNSVCIFSHVPMGEIENVYLDYQSRTSVKLAQVLLEEYWKQPVTFLNAEIDYIDQIQGNTAGVIIGDRALALLGAFPYVYDLSEHWQLYTGLPFVFAAWIANKDLPAGFLEKFNEANQLGFDHLDQVISENTINYYNLHNYYTSDIAYNLDRQKLEALCLFLKKLHPEYTLQYQSKKIKY